MNITFSYRPTTFTEFRREMSRYYHGTPLAPRFLSDCWKEFKAGNADLSPPVKFILSLPVKR